MSYARRVTGITQSSIANGNKRKRRADKPK
jgi:hypothetical protein